MKKGFSIVILTILLVAVLGTSVCTAETVAPLMNTFEIYVDGEEGAVYDDVSGLEIDPDDDEDVATMTQDEWGKYYLSFAKDSSQKYHVLTNAVNTFYSRWFSSNNGSELDISFTFEIVGRFDDALSTACDPSDALNCSGAAEDGGFALCVNQAGGVMCISKGTMAKHEYIKFPFEAKQGEWFHIVLTYDHQEKMVYCYKNGETVLTSNGEEGADVSDTLLYPSYAWNKGFNLGGGPIWGGKKTVYFGHSIAVFNFTQVYAYEDEVQALYDQRVSEWSFFGGEKGQTPTSKPTSEPIVTDAPTEEPTEAPSEEATQKPKATPYTIEVEDTNTTLIIVIAAAAVIIAGAAVAVILVFGKKK